MWFYYFNYHWRKKMSAKKMVVRLNCIDEHAYRTDKFLSESVPTTSTISDPTTRFEQALYRLALAGGPAD